MTEDRSSSTNPKTLAFVSDHATSEDLLDFKQVAVPVAKNIITTTEKSTPFTIGVYGEWGSGKTSFLKIVDAELRKENIYPIWFNAWKYNREENLWAALIQTILDQAKVSGNWYQRAWVKGKIYWKNIEFRRGTWELVKVVVPLIIRISIIIVSLTIIFGGSVAGIESFLDDLISRLFPNAPQLTNYFVKSIGIIFAYIAINPPELLQLSSKLFGENLNLDFSKLRKKRTYRQHIAFLDQFSIEFQEIVLTISPNKPLVVIVDDLDRCLPENALQVLEAIKLLLDVKSCVFLLAIDREIIEKAVHVQYKEINSAIEEASGQRQATNLLVGENYFDKIVQLTVRVPPISTDQVRYYIANILEDDSQISDVFAAGLPRNPRKIKRTLQYFIFMRSLLEERINVRKIKLSLLAKLVIIHTQFRELYEDLVRAPDGAQQLLEELEKHCYDALNIPIEENRSAEVDTLDPLIASKVERFATKYPLLLKVLTIRAYPSDTFKGIDIKDYLYLVNTIPQTISFSAIESESFSFFVGSHHRDGWWARRIKDKLESVGHNVILQVWGLGNDDESAIDLHRAAFEVDHALIVLSPDLVEFVRKNPNMLTQDQTIIRNLTFIRTRALELQGVLSHYNYIDMVGVEYNKVDETLLAFIEQLNNRTSAAKQSGTKSSPETKSGIGPIETGSIFSITYWLDDDDDEYHVAWNAKYIGVWSKYYRDTHSSSNWRDNGSFDLEAYEILLESFGLKGKEEMLPIKKVQTMSPAELAKVGTKDPQSGTDGRYASHITY